MRYLSSKQKIFVGKIVLKFFWKPTHKVSPQYWQNYLYFLFIKPNQKSTTNLLFYSFKKDINCWAIWQKSLFKMVCSSVCPIDWKTKLDLIWKSINFIWRRREITLEKKKYPDLYPKLPIMSDYHSQGENSSKQLWMLSDVKFY